MGVYDKVRGAKPTGGGNYFEADHEWIVMINALKDFKTRKNESAFIIETKVLWTDCERVRPGQERSNYIDMTKDAAPGNVVQFLTALIEQQTGSPPETTKCETCDGSGKIGKKGCEDCGATGEVSELDEPAILAMVAEDQPMAGIIIGLTTFNKPTQAGNPFTRHKWNVLPDAVVEKYRKVASDLGLEAA